MNNPKFYEDIEKICDINYLVNTIDNCFKLKNKTVKNLYMENGRYITGPYGWLLAKCNCVKHSFGATYYGLDACMANLMRPGMYGSYHHIDVYKKSKNKSCGCMVNGKIKTFHIINFIYSLFLKTIKFDFIISLNPD